MRTLLLSLTAAVLLLLALDDTPGPQGPQPIALRSSDAADLSPEQLGARLVRDLHCAACHELPDGVTGPLFAPDGWPIAPRLTDEGSRVQPGWLPGFLERPFTLRPAALARMPTFFLAPQDRLDFAAYLASLRGPEPAGLAGHDFDIDGAPASADLEFGKAQLDQLRCNQCHLINGKLLTPEDVPRSPDLALAASRLQRAWVYRWLLDPQGVAPGTKMPNFFYREGEPLVDHPDERIDALVKYVFSLGQPITYETLPATDVASIVRGAALFERNNCGGCHIVGDESRPEKAGPPLTFEGSRVQAGWVRQYFRTPHNIRPLGYRRDKLNRMPDFRLNETEVRAVGAYLMRLTQPAMVPSGIDWTLARPSLHEAEVIWARYQCGTCHAARPGGAYPGPSAATMARLQPEFFYQYCVDPTQYAPPPGLDHPVVSPEEAMVLVPVLVPRLPPGRP